MKSMDGMSATIIPGPEPIFKEHLKPSCADKMINSIRLVMKIEKVFFPVIFFLFSFRNALILHGNTRTYFIATKRLTLAALQRYLFETEAFFLLTLIIFNIVIVYALLVSRNLQKEPEGALEVFVPAVVTFWEYSYNLIPLFPNQINFLLIPRHYLSLSIVAGLYVSIAGLVIASISIFNLRKSFGIFVQVRDIVTRGFYRYVRHPIYLGHIMAALGFMLLAPRIYTVVFCGVGIALVVFRARLEEHKLSQFSEEYRRYMRQTPFIIPIKFKR